MKLKNGNSTGRLRNAFYSSITSAIYQVTVVICGFLVSHIIINNYGSSWNGVISSITKFLSVFTIVEAGINGATRVALYKSFAEKNIEKTSGIINANDIFYRKISFFLVLYTVALVFFLPKIIISEHDAFDIAVMVVIIGTSSFAENYWGINSRILLRASQRNYITNSVQTMATLLNAIVLVLIVYIGGSVFSAKIGSSIIYTIVPVLLYIISRKLFSIDKKATPDNSALKGRWDVIANSISNIVHENVDILFISFLCEATEISVYSIYYAVGNGLTKVYQIIINGIEAGFGDMWVKGEIANLKKNLRRLEFILYTSSSLLFGCMIVLVVPFMSVYAKDVTDANYQRYGLGIAIAIAQILLSVRQPYVLLVQAAGHYKQVKMGAFLEALINIVLTAVLVVHLGIIGAIIGTIVANLFRTMQYGWYISKYMIKRSFSIILLRILWTSVITIVSVVISTIAISPFHVEGWVSWGIVSIICFTVNLLVTVIGSLLCYKEDFISCVKMLREVIFRNS